MVRTVMYLFLVFVVAWNINATFHIFSFQADLAGEGTPSSSPTQQYCHPTAYW